MTVGNEEAWGPRDPAYVPRCEAGCQGRDTWGQACGTVLIPQHTPRIRPGPGPVRAAGGVNSEKDTGSHQQALRTDSYTMTGQGSEQWVGEAHGVGLEHRTGASGTGGQEGFLREGTFRTKARRGNHADA